MGPDRKEPHTEILMMVISGQTTQTHRFAVDVGASVGHQSGHVPAAVFGRPVKSRL